jgi:hypothetical protein
MVGVLVISVIIAIAITWTLIVVTNKAYSKKWEDDDNEKGGQV